MKIVVIGGTGLTGSRLVKKLRGAQLDDRSLTPGDSPRLAPTRFEDWLALHQPERSLS